VDTHIEFPVTHWKKNYSYSAALKLIGEFPLEIYLQGKPYALGMRTPGEEIEQVAGFCLAEGIVETADDFSSLTFCNGTDKNKVLVEVIQSRQKKISHILEKKRFFCRVTLNHSDKFTPNFSQPALTPLTDDSMIDIEKGLSFLETLSGIQPLREKTGASHAAAIYSLDLELLSSAEDVGRHNALDKAIGKLLLERRLHEASLIILSSRISYELVQKAARARIPTIFAISRPTSLAANLASQLNMTLACLTKGPGLYIFCGDHRLKK
jgi:FdhD protein